MYFDALKVNIVNSWLELHEEPELTDVGRECVWERGGDGGREYREYVTK